MSILPYLVIEIGVMSVLLALVGVRLSKYANEPLNPKTSGTQALYQELRVTISGEFSV